MPDQALDQSQLLTPEQQAYDTALVGLSDGLTRYVDGVWKAFALGALGSDPAAVIAMIASTVVAAQISAANLASVHIAQSAGAARAAPVVADDVVHRLGGVAKNVIYARAFRQAAYQRDALGKSAAEASASGLRRLQNAVATDMQMATIRQSRRSLRDSGRKYYRRITTGRESCALCLIASTQRYKVEKLLPIHPGCDCRVDVLPPGMDLDQVIDRETLEATHEQVKRFAGVDDRGGRIPDYRELIITHEHGEIGPVIAWRGHDFTGPKDLNKPKKPKPGPAATPPKKPAKPPSDPVKLVETIGIDNATTEQLSAFLTAKHGVAVVGFDPKYPAAVIRDYTRAVDDILTKYPQITIGTVRIGPGSSPAEYAHALRAGIGNGTEHINLSTTYAADPAKMKKAFDNDVLAGFHPPGSPLGACYTIMVHELGHALDYAGYRVARTLVPKVIRDMYDASGSTLSYESWLMANLPGYSWKSPSLGSVVINVPEALAEAFVDVEVNGESAMETSKVLHKILVSMAVPGP